MLQEAKDPITASCVNGAWPLAAILPRRLRPLSSDINFSLNREHSKLFFIKSSMIARHPQHPSQGHPQHHGAILSIYHGTILSIYHGAILSIYHKAIHHINREIQATVLQWGDSTVDSTWKKCINHKIIFPPLFFFLSFFLSLSFSSPFSSLSHAPITSILRVTESHTWLSPETAIGCDF